MVFSATSNRIALFFVAGILCFHLATLHEGHPLEYGDFGMYLMHAQSLAEGAPYSDTLYVYNPEYAELGPPTYPPIYPFQLASVYAIGGMNLTVYKWVNIATLCLALWVIAMFPVWRSTRERVLMILLVGLNPFVWKFKEIIYSDFLFLLLTYISLSLVIRQDRFPSSSNRKGPWHCALIGACVYLATGTRTLGILLLAAVVCWDLISNRRITMATILPIGVFTLLYGVQSIALHSGAEFTDQLVFDPSVIWKHLLYYPKAMAEIWCYGQTYNSLIWPLIVGSTGIAILGFGLSLRQRDQLPLHVFFVIYLAAIIVWPYLQGPRYVFPLIPLYLAYLFAGCRALLPRQGGDVIIAILSLIFFSSYTYYFLTPEKRPAEFNTSDSEAQLFFDAVGRETDPDSDLVIFRKPRVLALMARRRSSVYHEPENPAELRRYFKQIGATHIGVSPLDRGRYIDQYIQTFEDTLIQVFHGADYRLYKIRTVNTSTTEHRREL